MSDFYSIPMSFEQLLKQEQKKLRSPLRDSLKQHISLIITTRLGNCRFEPDFGCRIWDVDFVVPSNLNSLKEEIKVSLEDAIKKHEQRIDKILAFKITVDQVGPTLMGRIQQKLEIDLEFTIKGTNEKVHMKKILYFSPVSIQ